MGCRLWWGTGDLLDGPVRDSSGQWLGGVNGPRAGACEIAFSDWSRQQGLLCVRTVDLFWALHYHQKGFPAGLSPTGIKRRWSAERRKRQEIGDGLRKQRMPSSDIQAYLDRNYPEPLPWDAYLNARHEYFQQARARYDTVLQFWRSAHTETRAAFLAAAAAFNQREEGYPDYLAQLQQHNTQDRPDFGWVEVKSSRDTLNPTQRRFFPQLMSTISCPVWVAKMRSSGSGFLFRRLMSDGRVGPEEPLFVRPL